MTRLAYLAGAAALAAAFGFAGSALANTIVVAGDNVDCGAGAVDQTTIQGGIDAASAGDTVAVCPGTYSEDLDIFDRDGLTLIATDRASNATTVIQGVLDSAGAIFPTAIPNIDLQSHGVTITGFTIKSPAAVVGEYASGLIIDGTDNKIYKNAFQVSCGTPGSVAIQTWVNGSELLKNISGLTIVENSFTSLAPVAAGCLGYEAIFINNQLSADEADPVVIAGNTFAGRLYRGVGVLRSFTDVKFNSFSTTLFPQATVDFGNVPIGIKVFDFVGAVSNAVIASNSIVGGFIFFLPRFHYGIWLTAGTSDNIMRNNFVLFSATRDCLDDSVNGGTDGTANTWENNNTGPNDFPDGICG